MNKQFPCDVLFKDQLTSTLTVENCSKCASKEVCADVVTVIVTMLTPRFASMEELHSEGVEWKDTGKAIKRVAQLELREGRVLGEGYYIRSAMAHFSVDTWWQLMSSKTVSAPFANGNWFFFVNPGVNPNKMLFDQIIPPIGNPLREEMLLPTNPSIEMTLLDTAILHEHNCGVGIMDCFKECVREDEWQKLVLCNANGVIVAVNYSKAKAEHFVSKRVFISLLPDESALSDVEFWQRNCPDAVAELYTEWKFDAELHFRNWVSAEVWEALDSNPLAIALKLERERMREYRALIAQ